MGFHMLRRRLGDEKFAEALQRNTDAVSELKTTLGEVRVVVERANGRRRDE